MGQTTGGFSSTDVFKRVASRDWVAGATVSWSPVPAANRFTVGDYFALKVDSTCTLTIAGGVPLEIEYIVVAGGGAGGQRGAGYGTYGTGGGGAGGVLRGTAVLPSGSYTFNIGNGGSAASRTSGGPSFISPTTNTNISIIALGGGVGGGSPTAPGNALGPTPTWGQVGGSGGGAAYTVPHGVAGSAPQGFPGGIGPSPTGAGGGGGGAGRAGFSNGPAPQLPGYPGATGGQGGDGILVEYTGVPVWVAGGGGGGAYGPPGTGDALYGGYGGTGSGPVPGAGAYAGRNWYATGSGYGANSASSNTGGGGGGSSVDTHPSYINNVNYYPYQNNAGNGGSGVIFIRWKRI